MNKPMSGKKVALIGCGDIGSRLGHQLLEQGAEVSAFRRSPDKLPAELNPQPLDVEQPETLKPLSQGFDYLVITLSPDKLDDAAYQQTYVKGLANILAAIDKQQLRKLLWVSSTSVYGQSNGEWVDETSPTEPTRFSGQRQLDAEQQLEVLGDKACVVRFAGIYRDNRHRMVEKIRRGELSANVEQDYYTNRIQVQDCAGILAHLMTLDAEGATLEKCYIGSDSTPVLYSELINWIAGELGVKLNEEGEGATPRVGSKRCSNQRLLDSGYQFIYPTYKDGLREIIA